MLSFKRWVLILVTFFFLVGATGCGKEWPAEKVGKKADEAADRVKKKTKKPAD